MIIHFSGRSFHAMKEDAERERRSLGLPRTAYQKIEIDDRFGLARLLNGFIGAVSDQPSPVPPTPAPDLDWVPRFVREDWARREGLAKLRKQP